MSRLTMSTGTDETVHTIRTWATATEAYRSKALRQALFDGSVVMDDVLINLHGQEHRDRRRIENPLFRRDVLLAYERKEFPAVLSATLQPHLAEGRCELMGFGHQVMLNLSCVNAGIDRQPGDTAETKRLLGLLALFIDGARIHHYQGDRDAKVAEISQALEAFDAEFVAPSLRRRQQLLAEGNEVPRDVCSVLAAQTDLPRDVIGRELAFFLTAGASTSAVALTKTFHNLFTWLESRPEDRTRLSDDPEFVGRCIQETLRLSPISPIGGRRAIEDVTLSDGLVIRAGERVDIDIESANRDAEVFGPTARDFDPDRSLPDGVTLAGFSFGHGMHHCIGAELAAGVEPDPDGGFGHRLFGLVGVVVRELALRNVRPDPDNPPEWETTTARTAFRSFPVLIGPIDNTRHGHPARDGHPHESKENAPMETDLNDELAELRARVQRLEDREELGALVARYGRAVDDRDWESLADQYTPDAVFDSAAGRSVGTDAIIDYYKERTEAYVASYHYPHSLEITFIDDHTATGLVCAHAELTIEGETVFVALRYQDDYRRVDGRWCFHERETRILYVLKLSELPTGFADRMRIRWPGIDPQPAQVGADVANGRTPEPR